MFEKIGKFSVRFRYPILVGWAILLAATLIFAPNLSDVSISDQSGFLSAEAPSNIAYAITREYFPDQVSAGQAVLVIESENGSVNESAMQAYIAELTTWLENDLNNDVVHEVLSPADPDLADQLISEDEQAVMIYVGLNGTSEDSATAESMDRMQARLDEAPEGYEGYVTGGDAIVRDYKNSVLESVERTTAITIALVIVILLFVYRSPVSPLIPLITIGVSYLISRGLVAWLTNFGFTITSITDVFLVVLLFGAGTDYCLFIVSRFRENMADSLPAQASAQKTIGRVGETITSSAGTVIVGMIAMSFVELSVIADAGPSLAIGVMITLLAGLTLTPALLSILGRFAFWPREPRHSDGGVFWGRLASWVTERPWIPLILSAVILIPLAVYGNNQQRSFDMMADLPDEVPAKAGFLTLTEHFDPGEMQPLDVVILNVPDPRSPAGLDYIDSLTQDLLGQEGVADVRSLTLPAGQEQAELADLFLASEQIALMAAGMDSFTAEASSPGVMASTDMAEVRGGLQTMGAYLDELAVDFPDIESSANYQEAYGALAALEASMNQINDRLLVSTQLEEVTAGIDQALSSQNTDLMVTGTMQEQFVALQDYLVGLGSTHPEIAELDSYQAALTAIDELGASFNDVMQNLLLVTQLNLLSSEFAEMGEVVATNPLALMPQPGQPSVGEQMAGLVGYVEELGANYPELEATEDYQTVLTMLQQMAAAFETIDISQADELVAQASAALPVLSDAFAGLAETANESMPEAVFVPTTPLPGSESFTADILAETENFGAAFQALQSDVVSTYPEATYIPADLALADEMQGEADALYANVSALHGALVELSGEFENREDNYLIPLSITEGDDLAALNRMLDTYASTEPGNATRLQVVLADNPFSLEAQATTARLREQLEGGQSAYISGATATQYSVTKEA